MGFNAKTNLHAELARLRTVIHTERAVSPESQQSLVHSHLLRSVPIEMEHSLEVVLYDPDSLHVVSFVWHWDLCPSGCISCGSTEKSTHNQHVHSVNSTPNYKRHAWLAADA